MNILIGANKMSTYPQTMVYKQYKLKRFEGFGCGCSTRTAVLELNSILTVPCIMHAYLVLNGRITGIGGLECKYITRAAALEPTSS